MPHNLTTFAGRLRFARELRGFGVRELSTLAGLSHGTVHAIESRGDDDGVKLGTARELARVLDVRPEWLAFGIGTPPKKEPKAV